MNLFNRRAKRYMAVIRFNFTPLLAITGKCTFDSLFKNSSILRAGRLDTILVFLCLLISSCSDKKQSTENAETVTLSPHPNVTTSRTAIGETGYFIDLPSTHRIEEQKGEDFNVFYFTPFDTIAHHGEAGIYFGGFPDMKEPSRPHTKKEFSGVFIGQTVKWTEYLTDSYTQRETFIDIGNSQKIHVWCYSDNNPSLEKLFSMVQTISK